MSFPFLRVETSSADPMMVGEMVVTPRVQSLKLVVPGIHGGLVWNRPVSVLVQQPSGKAQKRLVLDITRLWEFGLAGGCLAVLVFFVLVRRRMNHDR